MRTIATILGLVWPLVLLAGPATTPQDRLNQPWWAARHNSILKAISADQSAQVVIIGDSITNNYDKAHPPDEDFQPIWNTFYAPRHTVNLGFSGDTTSNLLWRLEHGEVAGLHPAAAVVLIGTNNTGSAGQSAEETEAGIDAVVSDLENRLPATKFLLLGILPSAISDDKTARDQAVNRYLAAVYAEHPRVTYLDIGSIFQLPDGNLNTELFYDPRLPKPGKPLHPDTIGQHRMAEAIEPTLATLIDGKPLVPLDSMTDVNTALIPVPKLEQDSYDWYARHHAELVSASAVDPEVVMVGDSITHFWSGQPLSRQANGPAAWNALFGDRKVLNLGFGWDRTQNVLWRLRQGELNGLAPKWIVLLIGTNNLTGSANARANTPTETAAGIVAVYRTLHRLSPDSKILITDVLPRGFAPDAPLRRLITETNRLVNEQLAGQSQVTIINPGPRFLLPDGTLPHDLMPDGTHPSESGYQLWAEALEHAGLGQ